MKTPLLTLVVLAGVLLGGCPFTEPPLVEGFPRARLITTEGDIVVELFDQFAPVSVANFQQYVEDDFYDGTIFHRVDPLFVIQGGLFMPDLVAKETRPPIRNESTNGLTNVRGTLAMAWQADPNDATAEFFFNVVDNPVLDASLNQPGYAVFGGVVEGLDVVDAIANVETEQTETFIALPVEDVILTDVVMEPAERRVSTQWQAYFDQVQFGLVSGARDFIVDILGSFLAGGL
jgi:peptidyl-prolyl cis-trans isomerase A (cyclophilin A)